MGRAEILAEILAVIHADPVYKAMRRTMIRDAVQCAFYSYLPGFDPNQPRDAEGKWTDSGNSSSAGLHSTVYSPPEAKQSPGKESMMSATIDTTTRAGQLVASDQAEEQGDDIEAKRLRTLASELHEVTLLDALEAQHPGLKVGGWIPAKAHELAVSAAIKAGKHVPSHVSDIHANTVELAEKAKLKAKYGNDYLQRVRDMAKRVKEVSSVTMREDGTASVRRRQLSGGAFQDLAKGDIINHNGPKIVQKAGKPYRGTHDGETSGYFQEVVLREPKKTEMADALKSVAAVAASNQHDLQLRNDTYADVKRDQMREHVAHVEKVLGG